MIHTFKFSSTLPAAEVLKAFESAGKVLNFECSKGNFKTVVNSEGFGYSGSIITIVDNNTDNKIEWESVSSLTEQSYFRMQRK
jgi:hypothetical protein